MISGFWGTLRSESGVNTATTIQAKFGKKDWAPRNMIQIERSLFHVATIRKNSSRGGNVSAEKARKDVEGCAV
jgi:hypothetical protein